MPPPRRNMQPPIGPPGVSSPFGKQQLQQQQASPLQGPAMALGESRPGTPFRDFYHQLLSDKAPPGSQVGRLLWALALPCALCNTLLSRLQPLHAVGLLRS